MSVKPVEKHYFVIILAGTCGHCTRFKQNHLESTLIAFRDYGQINVVPIYLKAMSEDLPVMSAGFAVPSNLNKIVDRYPLFMMIPHSDWVANTNFKNLLLYGSLIDSTGKIIPMPVESPDAKNLLAWVKSNISTLGKTKSDLTLPNGPVDNVNPTPVGGPKILPTEGSCKLRLIPRK